MVTLPQHFRQSGWLAVSYGKTFHQGLDDERSWSSQAEFPDGYACRGKRWPRNAQYKPEHFCDQGWSYMQYTTPTGEVTADPFTISEPFERLYQRGPDNNPDGVGFTDYTTASRSIRALRSLDRRRHRPWFLCVGFVRPHLPFISPAPYFDSFVGKSSPVPLPPRIRPPNGASKLSLRNLEEGNTEFFGNYRFNAMDSLVRRIGIAGEKREMTPRGRLLAQAYAAAVFFVDAQVGRPLNSLT